jgi:ATP-dependent Clp protease ATP-binding subunit ClpC
MHGSASVRKRFLAEMSRTLAGSAATSSRCGFLISTSRSPGVFGHRCGVVTPAGEWDAADLFERFTERARQVVVLAQEESRSLKHNYIGTEHLLLGLLREHEGAAAHALHSLGVTIDGVREQVIEIVGSGEEPTAGQIPFTPRAKKVLELSLRESLNLGHNYIGTEHILLGLTRENEGVATHILLHFDANADTIRSTTRETLADSGGRWSADV